jgi:ElaB/YqjD/DUF883 family membrane-anchored ribosome-binding protein
MLKGIERGKDRADALVDRGHDLLVAGTAATERSVEQAASAVVEGTHNAATKVREKAHRARDGAHDGLDDAARALDQGVATARQNLALLSERTTSYVAANPGRSLLIAGAVGFAFGLLLRRRRDD